ncbi:MAG: CopY family transcriptional regulator [Gemmatimonas sp. SG8_17]|nr:MAG: CopY family transcriptional regulator [Gemmatimonas sp. SG8_17]
MSASTHIDLSRRERQIMDVIYARGSATVRDVMDGIPDPPSYSAVRAMLRVMEEKGHLEHRHDGPRYVYVPTMPHSQARESAMKQMLRTFFDGSAERAVAALLDMSGSDLSELELDRLAALIEQARKEGR